jgi:hypothetical protein
MGVLRGGPDNSQSELPCITRPLWLCTVTHRPVGPTGLYMYCASLPAGLTTGLLWPVVGTEKVGMRSADLSGYSVGSHLFIFRFDTFTGCGPMTLGWYSVGSHLILIY